MIPGNLVLLLTLALSILAVPLAAPAQELSKAKLIGFLGLNSPAAVPHHAEAFRHSLRELGWVDGGNIAIEYRWAEGRPDRLPALARDLVQLNVDVIVTSGAPAALAAKQATRTIAIVMAQVNDPVALGLVASLARPGGNITGFANLHSEMGTKHLELLKEIVPRISRVAVLAHPDNPGADLIRRHMQHATHTLGLTLQYLSIRDSKDLSSAFAAMAKQRADALYVAPDPLLLPHGKQIVDLAATHRLPAIYGWREFVESGGLMAYDPDIPHLFRLTATYVDKLLKGAKPADLPVQQATKFELVINHRTAKALGLTIPLSVLLRADQVIE